MDSDRLIEAGPSFAGPANGGPRSAGQRTTDFDEAGIRAHVLHRIRTTQAGSDPFRHLYVENILPGPFYEALRTHMLAAKMSGRAEDRGQDNPEFLTGRFSLVDCDDLVVTAFRAVLSDPELVLALAAKFFINPADVVQSGLSIHEEFEYTFSKGGRFQNIHVDIPPKYLSLVFYIPERTGLTEVEELNNATLLYGDDLRPHPSARFRSNSVCIFAPHFRSYHGFASTIDRDVLVMFYVNQPELAGWREMRRAGRDTPPFEGVRDLIEAKLRRHPLIEIGPDEQAIRLQRRACRINAPQGRVLRDSC